MMNHSIEYKLIVRAFDYELPLTGVDLDYLAARREDIQTCLAQLARDIGSINIASKKGVYEFDLANGLVKWYWYALCRINHQEEVLTGKVTQMKESSAHMYRATKGRTI